jgi:hypothetical protein
MKVLQCAILISSFVLSVACASDDNSHPHGGVAGFAGQAAAAGSGGQSETETGGERSEAGAENAPDTARQVLCERICATEAQLPCAPDSVECLAGWCPVMFPPNCQAPFDAMLGCVADQPVTGFECIGTSPFPRETVCVDQQAALVSCIQGLQG